MKSALRLTGFALVSAAFVFAGCSKKPRPNPSQTVLGGGPGELNPQGVTGLTDDSASTLQTRDQGWANEANIDRDTLRAETVYFAFDSAAIAQGERAKVQNVANYLKQNPGAHVRIEGHCDWRGTAEYNLGLGDRRARAVKDYLATLGADVTNVEVISFGDQGAQENAAESVMKMDRRADFAVGKW